MKSIIKENIKYAKQIFQLAKYELIKKYKGAALGPLWAIIKTVNHNIRVLVCLCNRIAWWERCDGA